MLGQQVDSDIYAIYASTNGAVNTQTATMDSISCNTNANEWNVCATCAVGAPGSTSIVATAIADGVCQLPPVCTCPTGFERISTLGTSTAPPYVVLGPTEDCERPDRNGVCRKMHCECDEAQLPFPSIPVTQSGECPTRYT